MLYALVGDVCILFTVALFGYWLYEFYKAINPLKKDLDPKTFSGQNNPILLTEHVKNSALESAWFMYQKTLFATPQNGDKSIITAQSYFNTNDILGAESLKRWQSYANIMLGLGILGTFVGLSIGLSGFNIGKDADIQTIKDSIYRLIPGMKTAFYTSVAGMSCSLLANFWQRMVLKKVNQRIHDFAKYLDSLFFLTHQEEQQLFYTFKDTQGQHIYPAEFMRDILGEARQQTVGIRKFTTDFNKDIGEFQTNLQDQFAHLMQEYKNQFVMPLGDEKQLTPKDYMKNVLHMKHLHMQVNEEMKQLQQNILDATKEHRDMDNDFHEAMMVQLNAYQTGFQRLTERLTLEFHEKFIFQNDDEQDVYPAEFMRDILGEARQQTVGIRKFTTDLAEGIILSAETLDQLADRFERAMITPITTHMVPVLEGVKQAVNELRNEKQASIEGFIESVSLRFTQSMESIADKFEDALTKSTRERLQGLADQIVTAGQVFEKIPGLIEQQITTSQEVLKALTQELKQEIQTQQNTVKDITFQLSEQMQSTMTQIQSNFETLIQEQTQGIKESMMGITDALDSQESKIQENTVALGNQMQSTMSDMSNTFGGLIKMQTEHVQEVMLELKEELSNQIARQQSVIQSFTRDIGSAAHTAMNSLHDVLKQLEAQQVTSAQSLQSVLDSTGNMLQTLEHSVVNITQALGNMDEAMNSMKDISHALGNTSKAINETGQTLEKITSAFAAESGHIYVKNQKTLEEILRTLERATNMTETFKQGLTKIFADIQEGLGNYRDASRETLNKYLGDFSEHLTGATRTLAGSISGMKEMVEDIADIHQQIPDSLKGIDALTEKIAKVSSHFPESIDKFVSASTRLENWAKTLPKQVNNVAEQHEQVESV